jgi:hypothetical protein
MEIADCFHQSQENYSSMNTPVDRRQLLAFVMFAETGSFTRPPVESAGGNVHRPLSGRHRPVGLNVDPHQSAGGHFLIIFLP